MNTISTAPSIARTHRAKVRRNCVPTAIVYLLGLIILFAGFLQLA